MLSNIPVTFANNLSLEFVTPIKGNILTLDADIIDTAFSPYETITREQLATMMYRVLKHKEANGWDWWFTCNRIKLRNIWKYDDDSDIDDYAIDAIYYLSKIPVVKGVSGGIFAQGNTATKQEAILMALRGYKYVINPRNNNNVIGYQLLEYIYGNGVVSYRAIMPMMVKIFLW